MDIEQIPEPRPSGPRNYALEVAMAVGLVFGAITFIVQIRDLGMIDTLTFPISIAAAVAGFGSAYAGGILACHAIPAILLMGRPATQEPKVVVPAVEVARPVINLPAEEGDPSEDEAVELTVFERRVLDDRRFRGPRGQVYETDGPVSLGILVQISRARAAGRLDTISPSQLNELSIISRHSTTPPNADTIISDLEGWGFVQAGGERRPYQWTESGRHLFPSPTDNNGQLRPSGVLSATGATAATNVVALASD